MAAMTEATVLAGIYEAVRIGFGQLAELAIILVVSPSFAVQQYIECVMKIIQPLGVETAAAGGGRLDGAGVIPVAFGDQVEGTAGLQGPLTSDGQPSGESSQIVRALRS